MTNIIWSWRTPAVFLRMFFDTLLAQAKAAETPAEQGDLESRVTTLEETSASKDDVQAVWDRMAAAYNEGVNEA